MARTSLPPGFRFQPTHVELVMYYLKRKLMGKNLRFEAISELNIYKFCPWDLPDKSCLRSKDLEWYFFCPRERKFVNGARMNRATENGYWKATGKDRPVIYKEKNVGMARTLVFHIGHAPKGKRTNWVMHEYRIEDEDLADAGVVQDAYVLCKVFQKSGLGPKNGAQYGAPFNEEDWNDDAEICAESSPVNGLSPAVLVLPNNPNASVMTSVTVPGSTCGWSLSEPSPSTAGTSRTVVPQDVAANDDVVAMLAMFREDPNDNDNNELNNLNHDNNVEAVTCLDENDMYNGLGDLGKWADLSEGGFDSYNYSILGDDRRSFFEIKDLSIGLKFPAEASGFEQVPTDGTCGPHNYSAHLEQSYCCGDNFLGIQNISGLNHSYVLPEGSNWQVDFFDV